MDPMKNWHSLKNNLDSFFGDQFLNNFENIFQYQYFPQVNVYQTEHEIICLASIPGLSDMNQVDVFIDHQTIELKGNLNLKYKGFRLIKDEIVNGHFERKIELPFPVKDDRVEATYQNGLLIIHLHRLIPDERSKHKVDVKKMDE